MFPAPVFPMHQLITPLQWAREVFIGPILQMGNLRLRVVRQPALHHTATNWEPWDLKPRLPDSKVYAPPTPHAGAYHKPSAGTGDQRNESHTFV